MSEDIKEVQELTTKFREMFNAIKNEVGKVIVGHNEIVDDVLISLFCGGHVLLESVPGLGKTLLVRTLSQAMHLEFRRIQFTPDLMPADIVGTNMLIDNPQTGHRSFEFQKGPLFGQIILADEINRATPKTQSAMLEAMQEKSITSSGAAYTLPSPFIVLATQNPIEQEGTYPLPEAQLDRFFFKLLVPYSNRLELKEILNRTTAGHDPQATAVVTKEEIINAQHLIRKVAIADHVQDYAIRLTLATHPNGQFSTDMVNRYISFGSSPRGLQGLVLSAKVRAVLDGRYHVSFDDITRSILPTMRHRIMLNFEAQADGLTTDDILNDLQDKTPKTSDNKALV